MWFSVFTGQGIWPRLAGTSQLLGLDLMITSDFDIKLIEVNNYPYYPIPSRSTTDFFHEMVVRMYVFHCVEDNSTVGGWV